MKYLLVKNKKIYKKIISLELKRLQYKNIFYNRLLPFYIRQHAFEKLKSLDVESSFVHLRQRCVFSNRSRSVLNFFKMSRMKLKWFASNNYINAIKKI